MKVSLALLLVVVAAASASPAATGEKWLRQQFSQFEHKFGRKYDTMEEREQRFAVFKQNLKEINEHNRSGQNWREGVTKFADLTREEFRTLHLNGYVNTMKEPQVASKDRPKIDIRQLPDMVDWRIQGAVTPVKDQGSCGSCWAFATVELIESYAFLSNQSLTPLELSPQQITSCAPNELRCGGNGGCTGSIPQLGFVYTQLFGITLDTEYPYTSGLTGQTGDCLFDTAQHTVRAGMMGYELLPRNDIAAVMNHLATVGPLAVAVDASAWGLYFGGVFDRCPYDQNIAINHAVQLVGYGTDPVEGDYWLVRNSWGPSWGEEGYIRLSRETSLSCGYDSTPLVGTGCVNDGNDRQYVCGMCGLLLDVTYPLGVYVI